MKFQKAKEYNKQDGCWWLTSLDDVPIEVVTGR